MLIWLTVVSSTLIISLASLTAIVALCVGHFLATPQPFADRSVIMTVFCLGGTFLVFIKHRGNAARLVQGTENRLDDSWILQLMRNSLHVIALGLWFGSGVFFIAFAASLFPSFKDVVRTAPSDRTAELPLAPGADEHQKDQLASAWRVRQWDRCFRRSLHSRRFVERSLSSRL